MLQMLDIKLMKKMNNIKRAHVMVLHAYLF